MAVSVEAYLLTNFGMNFLATAIIARSLGRVRWRRVLCASALGAMWAPLARKFSTSLHRFAPFCAKKRQGTSVDESAPREPGRFFAGEATSWNVESPFSALAGPSERTSRFWWGEYGAMRPVVEGFFFFCTSFGGGA